MICNKQLSQNKNTGGKTLSLKYVDVTKKRGVESNRGMNAVNKWLSKG